MTSHRFQKQITQIVILFSVICLLFSATYATIPHLINYQGRLTDSSGKPLDGLYNLTFRIYDAENAGTLLWQGTYNSVSIQKGIFNLFLGDISDTGYDFYTLAFDKPYYLEIKVGNEVMSPRQRITSAGYALRAEDAEKLGDQDSLYYRNASNINSGILSSVYGGTGRTAKLEASQANAVNQVSAPGSESDLDNMNITLTTKGTKLFISFVGKLDTGAESCYAYFKIYIDGSQVSDEWQFGTPSGTTHIYHAAKMQWLATGLTPGSHTVKIRWHGGGGYGPKISNRNLILLDLD